MIRRIIADIPTTWQPTTADLAFLQQEVGIAPFKVAKGIPLDARLAIAEEATATAFAGAEDTFEFPWWLFAIPLIREAFTRLKLSPFGPRMVPADFGRQPPPGGHQEARYPKRLADAILRARTRPPRAGARPFVPAVGQSAGGGKSIDARNLLQGMVTKARRHVAPPKTSQQHLERSSGLS